MSELEQLQRRGRNALVLFGWLWGCAVAGVLLVAESRLAGIVAVFVVATNVLPTVAVLKPSLSRSAKYVIAVAYGIHPAITVFALQGQPWQMDAHLSFLAALALLTILYDWRPIALASAVIATHHVLVFIVTPDWAFEGFTNLTRLAIHAAAVCIEGAALGLMAQRLTAAMTELSDARSSSEALVEAAQQSSLAAEMALMAASAAEDRAREERAGAERVAREARAERGAHLASVAREFQSSVTDVVASVSAAAQRLLASAKALHGLARDTGEQACGVAAAAAQASTTTDVVASHIAILAGAIESIASSASEQRDLSDRALITALAGRDAVIGLTTRANQIGGFTATIGDLSSTINHVALNASIEAARFGDAGLGFSVVAAEVKALAGQAGGATRKIFSLTAAINDSAAIAEEALRSAGDVAGRTAQASSNLQDAVSVQLGSSAEIQRNTRELAVCADQLAQGIAKVAGSADATRLQSDQVEHSAASLLENAGALHRSTQLFVQQLQEAQTSALAA